MLTLKTGLPRNGKTLSLVGELQGLLARWEKHPEEARPVFQFGIEELTLPGVRQIEAWPTAGKKGDPIPRRADGKPDCALTFSQDDIPDGALVCIDECQDFYPPRAPAAHAPEHVRVLNTHGHRNLDYVLLTQHPKLIDNAVRRLVNKHQHYRRVLGGKSAVVYEWDACSDSLEYAKAVKGHYRYPRKVFGLYKSATGFVKPKFKMPLFVLVPLLALPLAVWAIPAAFSVFSNATTGKGLGAAAAASAPLPGGQPARPGSDQQRGAAARAVVPVVDPLSPAGCMAVAERCTCWDQRGVRMGVADDTCRLSSRGFDGVVKWAARIPPPERKGAVERTAQAIAGPSGAP